MNKVKVSIVFSPCDIYRHYNFGNPIPRNQPSMGIDLSRPFGASPTYHHSSDITFTQTMKNGEPTVKIFIQTASLHHGYINLIEHVENNAAVLYRGDEEEIVILDMSTFLSSEDPCGIQWFDKQEFINTTCEYNLDLETFDLEFFKNQFKIRFNELRKLAQWVHKEGMDPESSIEKSIGYNIEPF